MGFLKVSSGQTASKSQVGKSALGGHLLGRPVGQPLGWQSLLALGFVGFVLWAVPVATEPPLSLAEAEEPSRLKTWCQELGHATRALKWRLDPCVSHEGSHSGAGVGVVWEEGGQSVLGRPLMVAKFGSDTAPNTTLVLATVHGDEITPLFVGLKLVDWLASQPADYFANVQVVVAPLVNPDGFFRQPRKTRTNAHGVDLNRNFATQDWPSLAVRSWEKRFHRDPRRNPGVKPRSEPETCFQEALIRKVRPQKILSIHSPLNFLDYDGPGALTLSNFPQEYTRACERLRQELKASSGGFYPGSLGNFAGKELGIPTLTLELPSAEAKKAESYWERFRTGIHNMIHFEVPNYASRLLLDTASESSI